MELTPTPSQTVGPFFHVAYPLTGTTELVPPDHPDALVISGTVFDGGDEPVMDALVEFWQANRAGRYAHPEDPRHHLQVEENFAGFGRCATNDRGRYEFVTVKPGRVPWPGGGEQAPHISVAVFARGLLKHVTTRIYFPDEVEANEADPLLSSIEDASARESLVARAVERRLSFDIHLQGENETTFFDV